MSLIEEKLTDQFYQWELRGRGWHVWDVPVEVEPPFVPFTGHYLPRNSDVDDGCKPTLLSSFVARLSGSPLPQTIPSGETEAEQEPEPQNFIRDDMVEITASLPANVNVSREIMEQVLLCLSSSYEPVAFELIACDGVVITQFCASRADAKLIQKQLEGFFPDGVFLQTHSTFERKWITSTGEEPLIVDFGLSREFMFQISTGRNFNFDPLTGIINALSELQEGEVAIFQILFKSVTNVWGESILRAVTDNTGSDFFVNVPELSKAARQKVAFPLLATVIRMGVKAFDYTRSVQVARNVAGALSVFSNPSGNEFIPLENDSYPQVDHEEDLLRRQTRRPGMILNTDELVSLVHLPSSSVRSPQLKRQNQKTKAVPKQLCHQHGVLLGENIHAGETRSVHLSADLRMRHMHIIGASGVGKSTFLYNLIHEDIVNGRGVAVFDPHGDLIQKILGSIPEERIEDVVLLDPSDEEYSVGFNILSAESDLEKNFLASDLVAIFQRLSTSWGDQMNSVLNNAILAFLESSKSGTLIDLRRFLIEPEFRKEFLKSVSDPEITYYWTKAFPLLSGNKSVGPIVTRLDTFLGRKPIRLMVSQKENKLNIPEIMNTGKIFLASLSQGRIGKENAYLLGSFLLSKFQQAAMARQSIPEKLRRDYTVVADEFHNFISPSLAEILSGARKYRVGLVLAHQELGQLRRDHEVASAVLSNAATRICFRVGDNDAKALESGFSFFEAKDLQNLEIGEVICRVERADFDFNLKVSPPVEASEDLAKQTRTKAIFASREKYSVKRADIERWKAHASGVSIQDEQEIIVPLKSSTEVKVIRPSGDSHSETSLSEQPEGLPTETVPTDLVGKSESADRGEQTPSKKAPADKGIGGNQHNLIRERLELVGKQLGYTPSREAAIGNGGKIDLLLEKGERKIACEIAITTTIDHEVGNIAKCLRRGFDYIVLISPNPDRLGKIKAAVGASLSKEQTSSVIYFHPDEFISFLHELTINDTKTEAESGERTFGKYKIKRNHVQFAPEELRAREETVVKTLAATMKKQRNKK